MADVSSEVQTRIQTLQLKHSALVDAVRAYTGGSVANTANELIAESEALQAYIRDQETNMIGIALQQYTGPVPALVLDFQNHIYLAGTRRLERSHALSDLGRFTRSGNTSVVTGGGEVQVVDEDTVPFAYDPTTGASRGLQVDPTSTNMVPSSNINDTDWKFTECDREYGKPAPDGTWGAVKIVPNSGAGQGTGRTHTELNIHVDSGKTYATSTFVKADGVESIELKSWGNGWQYSASVNLLSGDVSLLGLGTNPNTDFVFSEKYPNDWWRVTVVFAVKEGDYVTLQHASRDAGNNNGSNGFHVWGVQLEEHHTSTSLIPTTGSPVTRTMEHAYFSLGDMYSQATGECSVVVEFWFDPDRNKRALDGGNCILFGFTSDDGYYTPQRKAFALNSEGDLCIYWATNTLRFDPQPSGAGFYKVALTIGPSRSYWYLSGKRHPSWKDRLPEGPVRFSIMSDRPGNDALDAPSTYIRSIKYYPFELTQSEAEELTS